MNNNPLLRHILAAGVVAGTLDILAAIVLLANMNAVGTLKFIASGVFGKAAFEGGAAMVALGVVFHYTIATAFAAAYFLAYPRLEWLRRNKWISGVLYGMIVWSVMNLVVVPFSQAPAAALTWPSALKNVGILIVCIGVPIAWMAELWYANTLAKS